MSFRFSGKIARLLGRESVSSEIVALFELIKNSYDADATVVEVNFENITKPGGTIRIKDNGHGMTLDDFRDRWMIVGTGSKERQPLSKKGRRMVGEKGVGRFSTEKLAKKLTIISRPSELESRITVRINWEDYEREGALFDTIQNPVIIEQTENNKEEHGLEIILEDLRDEWRQPMMAKFAKEVGSLILPKVLRTDDEKFEVIINADEFDMEHRPIESNILQKAPFRMMATTAGNRLKCVIHEGKNRHEREPHVFERPPSCGPLSFQLYVYPQDAAGDNRWTKHYEDSLVGLEIGDFLSEFSGVRIYRDSFWVKPYGGKGNDWLELDKMRVARRTRVGNNQVVGFVKISRDKNPDIKDTTTRERLIENDAFRDMHSIIIQAIKEFNYFRDELHEKQKELEEFSPQDELAKNSIQYARKALRDIEMPEPLRKNISTALVSAEKKIKAYSIAKNEELDDMSTTIESQRSLVTLGLATTYIAHEVIVPLKENAKILSNIQSSTNKSQSLSSINKDLLKLQHNTVKLFHFMSFVKDYAALISMSIDDKWSKSDVSISEAWQLVSEGFAEVIKDLNISINFVDPNNSRIAMNPVDLESIITNLLTNSITSLKKITGQRLIKIQSLFDEHSFILKFSDNGPGVKSENRERIFEPLFTTNKSNDAKTHGAGLGLSLVREVLQRYDGKINLSNSPEYEPGATFEITIPLKRAPRVV